MSQEGICMSTVRTLTLEPCSCNLGMHLRETQSTVLLALDEYATFFNAVWTSAGGGASALSPDTDRLQKTATG